MGSRVTIDNRKHKLAECVAYIRERIPPEHRSCWSVYRRRMLTVPNLAVYYEWEFWFSKRYQNFDFEMKMRFG